MKNARRRAGGMVMLAGLMLNGCGSGDSGPPVALEQLGDQVRQVDCKRLVECHIVSDEPFCNAYVAAATPASGSGSLNNLIAAVNAGRTKYDGVAARGCLDQLGSLPCDQLMGPNSATDGICQKVFTGTIADGAGCTVDTECVPGSFCTAGVGTPPGSVNGGAMCAGFCMRGGPSCNDNSHCPTGQVCDLRSDGAAGVANGVCVAVRAPGAANQPCGSGDSCQSGLFCARISGAAACKPLAKSEEACEIGGCAAGLICALNNTGATGRCLAVAGKGQPCLISGQCGGSLLSSLVCDAATHVCVDAPTSGPCASDSVIGCNLLSAYCDKTTDTCQPFTPVGGACDPTTVECGFLGASCQPAAAGGTTGVCTVPARCN